VGTRLDWLSVLTLTVLWAVGTLTWGYVRRWKNRAPSLRAFPRNKRFGGYFMIALASFDFGLLTTFWTRTFHGTLLLLLMGTNIILATVIIAFRLLSPLKTT
jgi:hypothetical protein